MTPGQSMGISINPNIEMRRVKVISALLYWRLLEYDENVWIPSLILILFQCYSISQYRFNACDLPFWFRFLDFISLLSFL
jgi:hypothetical protein